MITTPAQQTLSSVDVDRFLDHLERRDRDAALAEVTAMLDRRVAPSLIVRGLLAPAQREVGRRWESGRWTVAQEHIASAITDAALHIIAARSQAGEAARTVAVACVEGEYHAIPARMLAEVLRSNGISVSFLGASLPVESVVPLLADVHPLALALSCSISTHLLEAEAAISAAHQRGVAVLVGGAGFGPTAEWARKLGADEWASSGDDAVAILRAWGDQPPQLNYPDRILGDHHAVRLRQNELEALVIAGLTTGRDGEPSPPGHQRAQRDVAASLVAMLAVALRLDEPGMLTDWAGSTLAVGQMDREQIATAAVALAQALQESPRAGELLRDLA